MDRLHQALVGVDIHKEQHTAVVLDCFGDRLGHCEVANRLAAFGPWLEQVQALAPGKRLLFGLENTSTWGRALADWLLAQGFEVRDVAPIRTDRKQAAAILGTLTPAEARPYQAERTRPAAACSGAPALSAGSDPAGGGGHDCPGPRNGPAPGDAAGSRHGAGGGAPGGDRRCAALRHA